MPVTSRPAADTHTGSGTGSDTGTGSGTDTGAASGDLVLEASTDALRDAFSERTRLVLVNTPHNPTGLMLGKDALQAIVDEAVRHDALIATDEVYEHLTFGAAHRPIATLPGAQDRTISISSAGKTFSVTGWKIGWITARAELITAITGTKQWLTYSSGAPFQPAVAVGLGMPSAAFADLATDLRERRDLLTDGLREIGFRVSVPAMRLLHGRGQPAPRGARRRHPGGAAADRGRGGGDPAVRLLPRRGRRGGERLPAHGLLQEPQHHRAGAREARRLGGTATLSARPAHPAHPAHPARPARPARPDSALRTYARYSHGSSAQNRRRPCR